MAAGTEHVNMHLIHIDGNLCIRLYRIGMGKYAVLLRDLSDLGDGLDGTDLVVGKHHADQNGIGADGCFQLVQADQSVSVHIQIGDLSKPLFSRYSVVICFSMMNGMPMPLGPFNLSAGTGIISHMFSASV